MNDERNNIVSRRGFYYDLNESPYVYKTPYGDSFPFASQKKLDIYTRDVEKELDKVEKIFARNDLEKILPREILHMVKRYVYRAFYKASIE